MEYMKYFFNQDSEQGILAAGYLNPSTSPEEFHHNGKPYYQCALVLEGTGLLYEGDNGIHPLFPGSVYQILPGSSIKLEITDPTVWKEFRISLSSLTYELLNSLGLLNTASCFEIVIKPYLAQWLPVLLGEYQSSRQNELSELFFNTQKLLIHIHKEIIQYQASSNSLIIESAKQIISSSFNYDISFFDIAAKFQMGYEKFRKLFKDTTGLSPLHFQLDIRFRYAQRFLTEGHSVKDTALKVGYSDPYIFSKQFKKYVGKSPGSYKNKTVN